VIDMGLDAVGQVDVEYPISELIDQIERSGAVDLVVGRVVAQPKGIGIEVLQRSAHEVGGWAGHDVLQSKGHASDFGYRDESFARPKERRNRSSIPSGLQLKGPP